MIEFSKPEERRTGANRIVLHRDLLTLAERAEHARQFDEAIKLYNNAPREHPDYIELRHRLGQLYHDDKRDYDRAIAEFERVQAIPEVDALVPDSRRIAYIRNDKRDYSPIYVVDVDTRKSARIATGTSINNDLSISADGVLAFRAQVEQWDRIFLVKLAD